MKDHTGISGHLKMLRLEAELSQAEVAARMQVDQSSVCSFELGKRDPRVSTVVAYANAIGARIHIGLEDPE